MYKGENHFDVKGKCESLPVLNEEVSRMKGQL